MTSGGSSYWSLYIIRRGLSHHLWGFLPMVVLYRWNGKSIILSEVLFEMRRDFCDGNEV